MGPKSSAARENSTPGPAISRYFLVFFLDRQTAWGFLNGVPFIAWRLRWFVFCGTSLWQPGSSTDWRVIIDAYRVWERDRGSRGLIRLFSLIVFMFTGFRDVGCRFRTFNVVPEARFGVEGLGQNLKEKNTHTHTT